MKIDTFGHIAVAKHFLNYYRKEGMVKAVERTEERIKEMIAQEIDWWNRTFNRPGGEK